MTRALLLFAAYVGCVCVAIAIVYATVEALNHLSQAVARLRAARKAGKK